MESSVTPGAPASAAELSLPQRIWGVLTSPTVVFQSLVSRPHLLGALIVLAVIFTITGFVLTEVGIDDQIAQMDEKGQLSGDDRETVIETTEKMMRIMFPVGWLVGGLVPIFIIAGVLLFISNVLLGGKARYRQLASLAAHVNMVAIPMLLVRIPLSLSQHTLQVQTSLAAFLPRDGEKGFLYNLLAQFDVFNLWMLALTILGVAVIAGVTLKRAATGILVAWGLWLLVWVPLQTMLTGLGGS